MDPVGGECRVLAVWTIENDSPGLRIGMTALDEERNTAVLDSTRASYRARKPLLSPIASLLALYSAPSRPRQRGAGTTG
jgi:hypothetical protein